MPTAAMGEQLAVILRHCINLDRQLMFCLFWILLKMSAAQAEEYATVLASSEDEKSRLQFPAPALEVEIRAPVLHYILSGPLAFSYRLLHEISTPQLFVISLVPMNTNPTINEMKPTITVAASGTGWKMMEFPCHILLPPGRYALYASTDPNSTYTATSTEVLIEVRWFQSSSLFLLKDSVQLFRDALPVNISLHTSVVCPQQQPDNLTLKVNLIYKQTAEAPAETVASRELAWPFGTMRSPHNTSILFGCQLFDRAGTYYATLAILLSPLLPDQSEITVATSANTATGAQLAVQDYSLVILGDLSYCATRNNGSRSIRISYRAPECVASDKIRLYRVDKKTSPVLVVNQTFLMERSIQSRPRGVNFNFPCRILWTQHDQAAGFCWIYTSVTRDGQSSELESTRKCLWIATSDKSSRVGVSGSRSLDGAVPRWSQWSTWSSCTQTCNPLLNVTSAVRLRKRTCMRKVENPQHWFQNSNNCVGPTMEIQICIVPFCLFNAAEAQEITPQEGNAFLWPLYSEVDGNHSINSASQDIIDTYNSPAENLLISTEAIRIRELFRRCALIVSGALAFFLVLNILLPFLFQRFLKTPHQAPSKSQSADMAKNGDLINRDSRCALLTSFHEEEVGVAPVKEVAADIHHRVFDGGDPSRSGVGDIEMRVTCDNRQEKETPKLERSVKMYRSPLPKHRNFLDEVLASDTPRSSVSFRPEASDADFEYDDFIPEKHEEVEMDHAPWAPQQLNLTVFAQDYEDIVSEFYDANPS